MKKHIFEFVKNRFQVTKRHKLGHFLVLQGTIAFLFLISSCSNHYQNLRATTSQKKTFPSIFSKQDTITVFNTSFAYKDFFASGLMVVKFLEKEHFRIVFTSKLGQTLLDSELSSTSFLIKKVIPQMNRKLLLNLLEKDLRLLCQTESGEAVFLNNENSSSQSADTYRLKTKKEFRYFYYNEREELVQMDRGSKRKPKVVVKLSDYQEDFPETITFTHQNFALTIKMKRLK